MVDDELRIDIYPHGYVEWRGPSHGLLREGLVPSTLTWPDEHHDAEWCDGRFDWWLRRCPGHDGAGTDAWALRRRAVEHRGDGFAAARRHEAKLERQDDAWQTTSEAQALRRRFVQARLDDRFQYFKARLVDLFDLRRR